MSNLTIFLVSVLFVTLLSGNSLPAEEVSWRLVDGLGRPLTGAYEVMLYQGDDIYKGEESKGVRYHFARGSDGLYHGNVQLSETPERSLQWIVSKGGRIVFHLSFRSSEGLGRHGELEIKQSIPVTEVSKLASLKGEKLGSRLLEILASAEMSSGKHNAELFRISDHIVSALYPALDHPRVSGYATGLLCLFSNPGALRIIAPRVLSKPEIHPRCAGALVSPSSPTEWEILKRSLISRGDETANAALALAANGSKEALVILDSGLRKAGTIPEGRIHRTTRRGILLRAMRWIESHPNGLRSYPELEKSIEAASGIVTKEWEGGAFSVQRSRVVFGRGGLFDPKGIPSV